MVVASDRLRKSVSKQYRQQQYGKQNSWPRRHQLIAILREAGHKHGSQILQKALDLIINLITEVLWVAWNHYSDLAKLARLIDIK